MHRLGSEKTLKAIEDMGLMSNEPINKAGSPLDTVSQHLAARLAYDKNERDMILMRHEVTVRDAIIIVLFLKCGSNSITNIFLHSLPYYLAH